MTTDRSVPRTGTTAQSPTVPRHRVGQSRREEVSDLGARRAQDAAGPFSANRCWVPCTSLERVWFRAPSHESGVTR
jgi:hypothetical protein